MFVPSGFYGKYRAVLDDDKLDHQVPGQLLLDSIFFHQLS